MHLQDALHGLRNNDFAKARDIVNWYQAEPDRFNALGKESTFDLEFLVMIKRLDAQEPNLQEHVLALHPITKRQQLDVVELLSRVLTQDQHQVTASRVLYHAKMRFESSQEEVQDRLNQVLWRTMLSVPDAEIDSLISNMAETELQKWWQISKTYSSSLSSSAWIANWHKWRTRHPRHESVRWIPRYVAVSDVRPKHIAVLLPQSGNDAYTLASKAIRDGWMTAHFQNIDGLPVKDQPTFKFYDTVNVNIEDLVQAAFLNGADVVVGPLKRDAVNDVANGRRQSGRILMLNRPNAPQPNPSTQVRHLAWSIEDEVAVLARAVSENQGARCVVLHGNDPWMLRARQSFESNLKPPAEVLAIDRITDLSKVTDVVGGTLGIEESTARYQRLRDTLNYPIEFTPRLNQQVNTVIAFIESDQLEAVLQSLRFHIDRPMEVFVTESAVRGTLPDLAEGVHFTASPWRVYESTLEENVRSLFLASPSSESFFAIGIDAYRFSNLWSRMRVAQPISGSAGLYRLDSTGGIRREPEIGIVRNGKLTPQPRSTVKEDITRFL